MTITNTSLHDTGDSPDLPEEIQDLLPHNHADFTCRSVLPADEDTAGNTPERKAEDTIEMIKSMRDDYVGVTTFPGKPRAVDRRALESFYSLNPAWEPSHFRSIFEAAERLRNEPADGTWLRKVRGVQSALNHIRRVSDEMVEFVRVKLPRVGETQDWYGLGWNKYRRG